MTHRCFALLFGMLTLSVAAGAARPVARLLEVKGDVSVQNPQGQTRSAAVYGTIYDAERLRLGTAASAVLGFRDDGHMERVRASAKVPAEVTVTQTGCTPKTAVEAVNVPKRHRQLVCRGIRELPAVTQGAVAMTHTGFSKDFQPWLRPIAGSTTATGHPDFSWPSVPRATAYDVTIYRDGDPLLFGHTDRTQLTLEDVWQLPAGLPYRWTVVAELPTGKLPAYEGTFTVASEAQQAEIAELKQLAADAEIPVLALAAKRCEQTGFFQEAIDLYQRLARLAPDAQPFRTALDELFARAVPPLPGNRPN